MPAVGFHGRARFGRVCAGERAAATAVAVDVHESGHDVCPVEVDVLALWGVTGAHAADSFPGHGEPAVGEHPVRTVDAAAGEDQIVAAVHDHILLVQTRERVMVEE